MTCTFADGGAMWWSLAPAYNEWTGPTFSPDKKVLFANIQEPGHTFAISADFS